MRDCLPSVRTGLQEQCDVSCSNVGCSDADDEADKTHADWAHDVPELFDDQ